VLRSTTTEASAAEGEEAGGARAIEEQARVVAELKDKEDDVAEAEAGEDDDDAEADDISGKIFNVMDFDRDAASRRLQDWDAERWSIRSTNEDRITRGEVVFDAIKMALSNGHTLQVLINDHIVDIGHSNVERARSLILENTSSGESR
jgi:hypothetical protein